MHFQAPSLSITPKAQILSALAAAAVAGGAFGVISIVNDDNASTKSTSAPVVSKVAPNRVLDGSPILRGTATRVDTNRVLDGSAILRGVVPAVGLTTVAHPRLDGAPFTSTSSSEAPPALQPPNPMGFKGQH